MVQAARSGVQNIAEGSQASATSRKTELKLTNVARSSLEELRLDYEDFLRQRGLPLLAAGDPVMVRFKKRRCATLREVQGWIAEEREKMIEDGNGQTRTNTDKTNGGLSVPVRDRPCPSMPSSALAANAALSLLNLSCLLLDRQLAAQAEHFEKEGGFTERMYRVRTSRRKKQR
jgi:four helix bundle suffix protein